MKKKDTSDFSRRSKEELRELYVWVDQIPLSRIKRNISRDFSDGVLMAEILHHNFPKIIDLHNYISAHSVTKKRYNWQTLKRKVFSRLKFPLDNEELEKIVNSKNGYIQEVLLRMKSYIEDGKYEKIRRAKETKSRKGGRKEGRIRGPSEIGIKRREYEVVEEKSIELLQKDMIEEKDHQISELKETNRVLKKKIKKLEALMRLKDSKIATLTQKIKEGFI